MIPEIGALLNKARESLDAATLLSKSGYQSFSASRAYYAMFYVAEAFLVSLGQSYSSHGGVIGAFGREFSKTQKVDPRFHRYLINAQDMRNTGDYGLTESITDHETTEMISWAGEFLACAQEYFKE